MKLIFLKVFGSTCYPLIPIPKEQRNKIGARSRKCIFLGYSDTSKEYRHYDEVNKKFVFSRDAIFIKTNKNDKSIERKLDCLEKFSHLKTYYEFDNEIPNLEGGILILDHDQSLEFPFEAPTPPHEETHEEEVPNTSPKLDDFIDGIGRLNLEENEAPPTDQRGPSKKIPNWGIKTLESVHPYEVGKTGTRNSKRHGGEADNSSDDLDVSFDCELNLFGNFEPTSFIEFAHMMNGKNPCKVSMIYS